MIYLFINFAGFSSTILGLFVAEYDWDGATNGTAEQFAGGD